MNGGRGGRACYEGGSGKKGREPLDECVFVLEKLWSSLYCCMGLCFTVAGGPRCFLRRKGGGEQLQVCRSVNPAWGTFSAWHARGPLVGSPISLTSLDLSVSSDRGHRPRQRDRSSACKSQSRKKAYFNEDLHLQLFSKVKKKHFKMMLCQLTRSLLGFPRVSQSPVNPRPKLPDAEYCSVNNKAISRRWKLEMQRPCTCYTLWAARWPIELPI